MKSVVKYQLSDFLKVTFFFVLFYAFFMIVVVVFLQASSEGTVRSNAFELSGAVACFVLGIVMLKEHYWMFAQNGISRKTFFKGSLLSCTILSLILSSITQVFVAVMQLLFRSSRYSCRSLIQAFYPVFHSQVPFVNFIVNVLFTTVLFVMGFAAGFLISVLFYRANRIGKILIAAGIPITVFFLFPMSYPALEPFWIKVFDFMFVILGGTQGNPWYAIITFLAISGILSAISYPVLKKMEI